MKWNKPSKKPDQRQICRVIQRAIYKGNNFFTQNGKLVIADQYVEAWTSETDYKLTKPKREKAIDKNREDARLIK